MSDPDPIECAAHGQTVTTFLCRHLADGVACGYHPSPEQPDDPWPDALCDLCAELVAEAGEWTDDVAEEAGVRVLCTHCYQAARDRNQHPPALARGAARELTEDEADRLLHHAVHVAQAKQAQTVERFSGDGARWDFDADARVLTLTHPAHGRLVADVQLVGSFSTRSETFQWAWETLDDDDPGAIAARQVRTFGEVRGLEPLVEPVWEAEEVDGWEMAALAGYLTGAAGIYRAPMEHVYWFMLLTDVRTAQ